MRSSGLPARVFRSLGMHAVAYDEPPSVADLAVFQRDGRAWVIADETDDDCFAIPFVNDTHLANDPSRDPDFDRFGHPRSQFQEVFSWLVPNVSALGGRFRDCLESLRGEDNAGNGRVKAAAGRAARRARASRRALASVSRAEARQLAAKHQIIYESGR